MVRSKLHGKVGQTQHGDIPRKGRGLEQGGSPEVRCMPQHKTRVTGKQNLHLIWTSFVPLWYEESGEGEGKVVRGGNNIFITR